MNSMAIAAIAIHAPIRLGADQAGSGIANDAIFLHAYGDDITGADKRPDKDVLRYGEQPFHERQPTIQLLRVLEVQPRRVIRDIGESERRVPVSTQRRVGHNRQIELGSDPPLDRRHRNIDDRPHPSSFCPAKR